jgi:ABC-type multidrug transport system permease subunit
MVRSFTVCITYHSFWIIHRKSLGGRHGRATTPPAFADIKRRCLRHPLSRAEFLAGKVAFNVLLAMLQAVVTVGLAAAILGVKLKPALLPLLFFGVVLGTAGWFFFFAFFALRIRRNDVFNSLLSLFYFLFLFASSMFYPLAPLPTWFRTAAMANPITWQVDLLRFSSIGLRTDHLLMESVAFVLFAFVAFFFGVRTLQNPK